MGLGRYMGCTHGTDHVGHSVDSSVNKTWLLYMKGYLTIRNANASNHSFPFMILRFKLISSYALRLKILKISGKQNLADLSAWVRRIRDYMGKYQIRVSSIVSVNQFIPI